MTTRPAKPTKPLPDDPFPWPDPGPPPGPAALPSEWTLEEVVRQTVRGALAAINELPPDQRPATITVAGLMLVIGARPATPPPGAR